MRRRGKYRNFKKFLLIDLGLWILIICFTLLKGYFRKLPERTDEILLLIFMPLLFVGLITSIKVFYFFRDKHKNFIIEKDCFHFACNHYRITVHKPEISHYRYKSVTFACASMTLFLTNGDTIKMSNLNDDFESVNQLVKSWNIGTNPYFL